MAIRRRTCSTRMLASSMRPRWKCWRRSRRGRRSMPPGRNRRNRRAGGGGGGGEPPASRGRRAGTGAGGVAPGVAAGDGGRITVRAPETVTVAWQVLAGERHRPGLAEVLGWIRDIDQRWELVPASRGNPPEHSRRLAALFPEPQYKVSPEYRDVRGTRLADLFGGAPPRGRLAVAGPLRGGVLAALGEL